MLTLYLLSLAIIIIYTTVLFFIAQKKQDNSIIDITYGPIFIVTAYTLTTLKLQLSSISLNTLLILLLITIWGARLSYRIYQKNKGKPEDFRYKVWREEWSKKGHTYFLVRSYLQIFILQGVIISLVLLPFTLSINTGIPSNHFTDLALLIWIVGFFFEAVGDKQLDIFIKNKATHKGIIMKTGLWKYTRHPNYFGEAMMWLGLACIAVSAGASFLVFISPLLITYLLIFISGIPMLEKKWEGITEWEVYKNKTSAFIPLPPKSI